MQTEKEYEKRVKKLCDDGICISMAQARAIIRSGKEEYFRKKFARKKEAEKILSGNNKKKP